MDAQIEALSLNNNAPSDEVEQEIRKLLLKNFEDLHNIDSEIFNLEKHLKDLKTKRDATQRTRRRYQSILSPIRRMSPEILAEIFYRCLPTHRNPIIKTTECPLLLTHICSFWRAAAISEPRLWARIYTTFSTEDMPMPMGLGWGDKCPVNYPEISKRSTVFKLTQQRACKTLHRRLNVIKEWLSRSGTRPLSISVCFTTTYPFVYSNGTGEPLPHIALEFFEYLAQLSPRFEDLELNMEHSAYQILVRMIDTSAMTRLTSLRAQLRIPCPGPGNLDPIVLLQAPNLREISMMTDDISLWGILNPSYTSVWRRVTDVSIHDNLTPIMLIFLLKHTPNLVHFKATVSRKFNDDLPVLHEPGYISLPFLRAFSIKDRIGPFPANLGLYNRIDAPGLAWVEYTGTLYAGKLEHTQSDHSIVAFLQRLPSLKKLAIDSEDRRDIPGHGFERIFRAVPSITHLFIGDEKRIPCGSLVRSKIPSDPSWSARSAGGIFKIDELIVTRNGSNFHSKNDHPLLPNLVSLEMSRFTSNIKDEDLIRFVISRMNPPLSSPSTTHGSGSGIAQLKHVGIVFYRQKERDVVAEIQEHANRVGADMTDLFLDYPEPLVPEVKPTAPEYGLRALDGRSWNHRDAEEFYSSLN